jgi:hypothetical protein
MPLERSRKTRWGLNWVGNTSVWLMLVMGIYKEIGSIKEITKCN